MIQKEDTIFFKLKHPKSEMTRPNVIKPTASYTETKKKRKKKKNNRQQEKESVKKNHGESQE